VKLALLAAVAALAACPGTASGATPSTALRSAASDVVLQDGPGDVWSFSNVTLGYLPAVQPAADVLRARVTHGAHAVGVRMVFDDLKRENTQRYYCDIHTPGLTSRFIIEAAQGHWGGTAWQEIEGEWVHVPGLSHHIDYASDVVTLRVSGALLGPRPWVRVRLRNEMGLPDNSMFFTDNPTTAGPTPEFTARLRPAAATGAGSSGR
jgi:hypothetical protein